MRCVDAYWRNRESIKIGAGRSVPCVSSRQASQIVRRKCTEELNRLADDVSMYVQMAQGLRS